MILTSKKMIFEKKEIKRTGLFRPKTEKITLETVILDSIKIYNSKAQIKQKNSDIYFQTTKKNFTVKFDGILEARKCLTKITDALTGTTILKRGTEKIKETFNTVDDVLGFNTRSAIKDVTIKAVVVTLFAWVKKHFFKK